MKERSAEELNNINFFSPHFMLVKTYLPEGRHQAPAEISAKILANTGSNEK